MKPPLYAIFSLLVIVAVCLCAGTEKPRQADEAFNLNGKPIHPMSIAPLVGDLADEQPIIAAVDLEGSGRNKSNDATVTADNGRVISRHDGGFAAYRYVGATPGGLHVLIVMVNGGGSGVFEDALWVKMVHDRVSENGEQRDRTMLLRVGQFTLGDRDDGAVRLNGANLFVGKSRYRDKDTTIPLE